MKFAHFSHAWNKPGMTPAQRYEQLWWELSLADKLGFDFGFTVEHHFNPQESWMASPPGQPEGPVHEDLSQLTRSIPDCIPV